MELFQFGNPEAKAVLIQPVGAHDPAGIEREIAEIQKRTKTPFSLLALKTADWNTELSPWKADAVFGNAPFGGGAAAALSEICALTGERDRTYYIGGDSLAGLFALWAACQTDIFEGVSAASPSVWFPGFTDYLKKNEIQSRAVYLSLGDREAGTRNPVMASVGNKIRETYDILNRRGVPCCLEWNPGNHFQNADRRTAKAFAWLLNR